jgi:hypothetical protein
VDSLQLSRDSITDFNVVRHGGNLDGPKLLPVVGSGLSPRRGYQVYPQNFVAASCESDSVAVPDVLPIRTLHGNADKR